MPGIQTGSDNLQSDKPFDLGLDILMELAGVGVDLATGNPVGAGTGVFGLLDEALGNKLLGERGNEIYDKLTMFSGLSGLLKGGLKEAGKEGIKEVVKEVGSDFAEEGGKKMLGDVASELGGEAIESFLPGAVKGVAESVAPETLADLLSNAAPDVMETAGDWGSDQLIGTIAEKLGGEAMEDVVPEIAKESLPQLGEGVQRKLTMDELKKLPGRITPEMEQAMAMMSDAQGSVNQITELMGMFGDPAQAAQSVQSKELLELTEALTGGKEQTLKELLAKAAKGGAKGIDYAQDGVELAELYNQVTAGAPAPGMMPNRAGNPQFQTVASRFMGR